jgi:hypothetical protein
MCAVERKDMDVVYRKRCCQLNKFYSMLIKDNPGYIPTPNWSADNDKGPPPRAKELESTP